jgi:hypothetical protein
MSPPTTAATIPKPTLAYKPKPRLLKSHEAAGKRSGQCSDN